jgi:glycerate 2-kinase
MRIVVAPDSFKESLSSGEVALAIAEGIKRAAPEAEIICIPMADGGEGTVDALVAATSGRVISVPAVDPLNRPVQSFFGVLGDGKTAVIEMAAASGLELLAPGERNPLLTSTFGTGMLIQSAMESGFREIILGIGGSATNDGGAGMAQALGFQLLDKNDRPIEKGGRFLKDLHRIDCSGIHLLLSKVKITVACDVQNPLTGSTGATLVYGPQKGATSETIDILEQGMVHYAHILQQTFGIDYSGLKGAGAAGGLGAGLMAFCNAQILPGFNLIATLTNLEEEISQSSLVLTGEGKIDRQTAFGKTISGIAGLGRKHHVPVVALTGKISGDISLLHEKGLTSAFAIANRPMELSESMSETPQLLTSTTEQIIRLLYH